MVKLFATIQNQPRETQLLALAAAFVLQAEAFRFPTSDMFAAVVNLMRDPSNPSQREHRFDAMKFHLETELNETGDKFAPSAA